MKKFGILLFILICTAYSAYISAESTGEKNIEINFNKERNEKTIRGDNPAAEYVMKTVIGVGCEDQKIYFKVGDQIFSAKQEDIGLANSRLKEFKFSLDTKTGVYEYTIQGDLGCKQNPAPFVILSAKSSLSQPFSFMEYPSSNDTLKYIKFL